MNLWLYTNSKLNNKVWQGFAMIKGIQNTYKCLAPWVLIFSVVVPQFIPPVDVSQRKQTQMWDVVKNELLHFAVWSFLLIIDEPCQTAFFTGGINPVTDETRCAFYTCTLHTYMYIHVSWEHQQLIDTMVFYHHPNTCYS